MNTQVLGTASALHFSSVCSLLCLRKLKLLEKPSDGKMCNSMNRAVIRQFPSIDGSFSHFYIACYWEIMLCHKDRSQQFYFISEKMSSSFYETWSSITGMLRTNRSYYVSREAQPSKLCDIMLGTFPIQKLPWQQRCQNILKPLYRW